MRVDAQPGARGSAAPKPCPVWERLAEDPDGAAADVPAARRGARNMALDELLLRRVGAGGPPAFRFYRWDPPCLSLGRNQPARGRLDPAAADRLGIDVVRRPTGGLAVLHHHELTYAAAVPVGLLGSPRESYLALSGALAAGLRALGAPAEVVGADPPAAPRGDGRPPARRTPGTGAAPAPLRPGYLDATGDGRCFAAAAPGEIAVGGRKLVGSAQKRVGRVLLQHGSILLDGGQEQVARLFGDRAAVEMAPTTLRAVLGAAPPAALVAAALEDAFRRVLGIGIAPATLDSAGRRALEELEARYRSPAWTWRC